MQPPLFTAGYLESLPPPSILESRVNQFLQLGGSQLGTAATQHSTAIANAEATAPEPAPHGNTDIVRQALELAMGSSDEAHSSHQSQPRTMISINSTLPALSTKLLQRIWADEYIDFAELPPAKAKPRTVQHYMEGPVLLVQMQDLDNSTRKAIPDFTTWAQCFALYAAAIIMKQPDRATDLMAYFFTTASNANKYKWPSWLVYDQNFRQLMANTQDKCWAKTNVAIFTQCFIHAQRASESWCRTCHSIDHVAGQCPFSPPTGRGKQEPAPTDNRSRNTICKDFNNRDKGCRWGANCFRRHLCLNCRGPHPKFKCRGKSEESSSTTRKD